MRFSYEEWLLRFVTSVSWRILEVGRKHFQNENSTFLPWIDAASEVWRSYLLSKTEDAGPYEHHIFFLDRLGNAKGFDVPRLVNWYFLRALDATVGITDKGEILCYGKLAHIIVVSFINPPTVSTWRGTKIQGKGEIGPPQQIRSKRFGEFLMDRARIADRMKEQILNRARRKE